MPNLSRRRANCSSNAIWVVSHGLCIIFQMEIAVPRMLSAKILRLIANCVRHLIQLQRDARSVAISSSKTQREVRPDEGNFGASQTRRPDLDGGWTILAFRTRVRS
jgi:hypothetical protein